MKVIVGRGSRWRLHLRSAFQPRATLCLLGWLGGWLLHLQPFLSSVTSVISGNTSGSLLRFPGPPSPRSSWQEAPALSDPSSPFLKPPLSYRLISIPDICHFFSTDTIFGSIFLHAKACESHQNRLRDKTKLIKNKMIL